MSQPIAAQSLNLSLAVQIFSSKKKSHRTTPVGVNCGIFVLVSLIVLLYDVVNFRSAAMASAFVR